MTAFRLELRRDRALAAWSLVVVAAYGAAMGLVYPMLRDHTELVTQYLNAFPKGFLAAFGISGSLADPGVFFTTYIASWLWPVVAAAVALLIGTRVPADLDRGFLDLPLATPISRVRYLGASIAGQALVLALLAFGAVWGLWIAVRFVGTQFDFGGFALATVEAFLFGCAIAGPTTLLAVVTLSRSRAAGIVAGVLIAMYLVFVVTQIDTDLAWISPISLWDHFRTIDVIDNLSVPAGDALLFVVMAAAGWGGALVVFRRRDLAA
jgi:ABC-2 type transport system permease protein